MNVVVVGLGNQGQKRARIAGRDVVALVDPVNPKATHKQLCDVPLSTYDAALVCTPDEVKIELLEGLLAAGKHVLVEKPLVRARAGDLEGLEKTARRRRVACYTAYNHRFEPNITLMRDLLSAGTLGEVYCVRLFYGNGTARLVRDSTWRDAGSGVLHDLGSHLLDLLRFFWREVDIDIRVVAANRFENRAYDHVVLAAEGPCFFELEMSLLCWRNHFSCDVFGEHGSAHVSSLCKWGGATFIHRQRILPSGVPREVSTVSTGSDPTWKLEYAHFLNMCANGENNLASDIWIDAKLARAADEASKLFRERGR